jgi:DNA gyrase subunit A
MFKLADGEKIVRVLGFDPRLLDVPPPTEGNEEPEPPYAIGISRQGMVTKFSLRTHRDPSTKSGRRYMRLSEGDEVLHVGLSEGTRKIACATKRGSALVTTESEVPVLGGPGKGVKLIKLANDDEVVAARVYDTGCLVVENETGKQYEIHFRAVGRGGKGTPLFKRGALLVREVPPDIEVPQLEQPT